MFYLIVNITKQLLKKNIYIYNYYYYYKGILFILIFRIFFIVKFLILF